MFNPVVFVPKNDLPHFLVIQLSVHLCVFPQIFPPVHLHCSPAMWCISNPIKSSCPGLTLRPNPPKLLYKKSLCTSWRHCDVDRFELSVWLHCPAGPEWVFSEWGKSAECFFLNGNVINIAEGTTVFRSFHFTAFHLMSEFKFSSTGCSWKMGLQGSVRGSIEKVRKKYYIHNNNFK